MACLGGALLRIILLVLVNLCGTLFVEAVNYKSCKYEILAITKKFLEKKRISRILILSDYYVFSEINKTRRIMTPSATAYYTVNGVL